MTKPLLQMRPWAVSPFWRDDIRIQVWSWARRSGKSFTMASRALRLNMTNPHNLCTYLSANLRLGGEFLLKEHTVWRLVIDAWRKSLGENHKLETSIDGLSLDDALDIFDHNKFETKIWHSRTSFSRSVVVPATTNAVGYGGHIFVDEFGRIADFRDVLESIMPFMDENPSLTCVMASTPPPDDSHYSYELTVPPDPDFKVNPEGNWYISRAGLDCHRVDAWDRQAAGFHMFHPRTGAECTPEEHREASFDKQAWDRNNALKYIAGGTSALSIISLEYAMAQGRNFGVAVDCTEALSA